MTLESMTLGRLIELYKAEREGKTIIMRTIQTTMYDDIVHDKEVKLSECNLENLVSDHGYGVSYEFFIKGENGDLN